MKRRKRKKNKLPLFPLIGRMVKMGSSSLVTTVIKSSPYLARMSLSLFWMYLTLGRRVHKTRKAFEKQLILQGMSKEDAKRLSVVFEELKNNITGMIKRNIRFSAD
jgi:hypothetical protein